MFSKCYPYIVRIAVDNCNAFLGFFAKPVFSDAGEPATAAVNLGFFHARESNMVRNLSRGMRLNHLYLAAVAVIQMGRGHCSNFSIGMIFDEAQFKNCKILY